MIKRIIQLSILIFTLLSASGVWATTYYIDWVNGADTNDGITKTTPWKRAPGMYGCSGNSLAKRNAGGQPGDRFILKGGVTWPRAALSWDWYFGSGTQANPIYFGVDPTWYSGDSWTRPILDAEHGLPNASPEGITSMMRVYGTWFVVDNLEFTGLAQLNNTGTPNILTVGTSTSAKSEIKNCYFHGWSHGGTATQDNMRVLTSVNLPVADMDLKIHDNVIDGADTSKDMAAAYCGSAGHFYNNYIANMRNGWLSGFGRYVWGNTFYHIDISFDPDSHGNVISSGGAQSIFYNNYIKNCTGGATIFTTSKDGYIDYVFNNVIVADNNPTIQIDNNGLSTGVGAGIYVFNNTLQAIEADNLTLINGPTRDGYPNLPFMTVRNNHLIANSPTVNFGTKVDTETESNNVGMTNAQATAANYVSTGTYPYAPPSDGATVGAGVDLSTLAASIPSSSPSDAATAALSDTTCGVKYDATNHRVIGPNKPAVVRGTVWDVGAYQVLSPPQNFRIISP